MLSRVECRDHNLGSERPTGLVRLRQKELWAMEQVEGLSHKSEPDDTGKSRRQGGPSTMTFDFLIQACTEPKMAGSRFQDGKNELHLSYMPWKTQGKVVQVATEI